ncbi:MAG: hypothetical protein Q8K85_20820, partial [Hyphomicrobium sp.]|nr:hypothetical protein [Hyphomicrobium sp.]
ALALVRLKDVDDPGTLKASGNLLGLLHSTEEEWRKGKVFPAVLTASATLGVTVHATVVRGEPFINARIAERNKAKAQRKFAESDRIRDELKAEGILLEDGPEGTTWRRA